MAKGLTHRDIIDITRRLRVLVACYDLPATMEHLKTLAEIAKANGFNADGRRYATESLGLIAISIGRSFPTLTKEP